LSGSLSNNHLLSTPLTSNMSRASDWTCKCCQYHNFGTTGSVLWYNTTECRKCGKAKHAEPNDWQCTSCKTLNFSKRDKCRKCNTAKSTQAHATAIEAAAASVSQGQSQRRAGDWDCTACGNMNFSSRSACRRCSTARPSAPAVGSGITVSTLSSPGQGVDPLLHFGPQRKAGDWDCTACGKMNFGSRTACYQCSVPRPAPPQASAAATVPPSDAATCQICFTNKIDRALDQCGHTFCNECIQKLQQPTSHLLTFNCPMCRTETTSVSRIYL
jgi:hypothetical protein